MIKYACTGIRLANWILRQVNEQPGMMFPKQKGWQSNVRMVYPGDQSRYYVTVIVFNQKELLMFVPLNSQSEPCHIKYFSNQKLFSDIKKDLGLKSLPHQLLFMTSERHEEAVAKMLQSVVNEFNLLSLDYEKMAFVNGNFKNPRLEFRLASQTFDTDLIPNFLPEILDGGTDSISSSLFYQNLFYNINQKWLSREALVYLRQVLKQSIPYWRHYRKKDQRSIVDKVGEALEQVFKKFSFEGFDIKREDKEGESYANAILTFPEPPNGRKEVNAWLRKQDLALEYIRDEYHQISIDSLVLEVNL